MFSLRNCAGYVLLGLIFMQQGYADRNNYDYNDLIINLQNIGVEHCYLIDQSITQGQVIPNFPSVLPITGIDNIFTVHGKVSEFTVKYSCGVNKEFSLHMTHFWKKGHWHRTLDTQFMTTNIFEKHTTKLGWRKGNGENGAPYGEPTKTTWIFSHGF